MSPHPPDTAATALPPTEELAHAVDILRLLADPTRLAIMAVLGRTEMPVTALATTLGRPVPGVSQHLARLRNGRLVTTRRDGTTIYYSPANEHVIALVTNVLQQTEHTLYVEPPHHR